MQIQRTNLIHEINNLLNGLSDRVKTTSKQGLTDNNHTLEAVCQKFFNALFGWNLVNLNLETTNYPAVDLGDEANGIAIQITNQHSAQKITTTAEKAIKHALHTRFKKCIVFFLLPQKPSTPKKFTAPNALDFQIWSIPEMMQHGGGQDIEQLKTAHNILCVELGLPPLYTAAPLQRIEFNNLPKGSEVLIGREKELTLLDRAWADAGATRVLSLVAAGGTGKTSLMREWLLHLSREQWRGAQNVYCWSFYSQGSGDDRQASEDHFLEQSLQWFKLPPSTSAHEKGTAIAKALMNKRSLLVLDGLEPLQYPPGTQNAGLAGQLRAPGLKALLGILAEQSHESLCVISTREALSDLKHCEQNNNRPQGSVLSYELGNLDAADGARLLHRSGATHLGALKINDAEEAATTGSEWQAVSKHVKGHALTLSLLGGYLGLAFDGDLRQWQQVNFADADNEVKAGHAFRVMAAYERWFADAGDMGTDKNANNYLAVLRLLGLFDRPASKEVLRALREAPAIQGLTRPLVNLTPQQWQATLKRQQALRLLAFDAASGTVDAHPLVREYFAAKLKSEQSNAWREGHKRIYEHLKTSTPHRPEGLAGLQPLYQAVRHGCQAGLYQDALHKVYIDRILRAMDTGLGGFYSTQQLGAMGDDLGAVACFFSQTWKELVPDLTARAHAFLLNEAAYSLRALGRSEEALELMQVGAEMGVRQRDWANAAISYGNLSDQQLTLGLVSHAVASGAQSVQYADQCQVTSQRYARSTTYAYALQAQTMSEQAQSEAALRLFKEAEDMQKEDDPEHPLLYSQRGFRYCELLLAPMELALWQSHVNPSFLAVCQAVTQRAQQTLVWSEERSWTLDIALNHLSLSRSYLYRDLLAGKAPSEDASQHAQQAVDGLRQSGQQDDLPRGLLTRAWLYFAKVQTEAAKADLDEAQRIAQSGQMRLFLADIALMRAKFLHDRAAFDTASQLIEACGYGYRQPFLEALAPNFA